MCPRVAAAAPRLLRLRSGPILLAGGRYTKDSARWTNAWAGRISWEPADWVNYKGDGLEWEMHSISYYHNLLEPNKTLHFTKCVNDTGKSCAPVCAPNCKITRTSSAYNTIMATGNDTAVIVYDHLPPPCMGTCAGLGWSMQLRVAAGGVQPSPSPPSPPRRSIMGSSYSTFSCFDSSSFSFLSSFFSFFLNIDLALLSVGFFFSPDFSACSFFFSLYS